MYMFRFVLTRETRWCQNNSFGIDSSELISEKKLLPHKTVMLTFGDLWNLKYWAKVKSDGKNVTGAAQELSSTFSFFFLAVGEGPRDNGRFSWEETITLQKLAFDDLWWPDYWPERKMAEMTSNDLVKSFRLPSSASF